MKLFSLIKKYYENYKEQQYYFCDKDRIDGWLRNGYGKHYEHSTVTKAIEKFLSVESDCIKDL